MKFHPPRDQRIRYGDEMMPVQLELRQEEGIRDQHDLLSAERPRVDAEDDFIGKWQSYFI